jgi:hypothetical protein
VKFTSVLKERDWQALLRRNVVKVAAEKYRVNTADLGAPQLWTEVPEATDDDQGHTPVHPAETGPAFHAVSSNLSAQADTLMEVALVKLSTWFSGSHKFGFVLTGQVRLVRSSDLVVLASSTQYYVSPSLPLRDWINHDGAPVEVTVRAGIDYLAEEMAREYLHAP